MRDFMRISSISASQFIIAVHSAVADIASICTAGEASSSPLEPRSGSTVAESAANSASGRLTGVAWEAGTVPVTPARAMGVVGDLFVGFLLFNGRRRVLRLYGSLAELSSTGSTFEAGTASEISPYSSRISQPLSPHRHFPPHQFPGK